MATVQYPANLRNDKIIGKTLFIAKAPAGSLNRGGNIGYNSVLLPLPESMANPVSPRYAADTGRINKLIGGEDTGIIGGAAATATSFTTGLTGTKGAGLTKSAGIVANTFMTLYFEGMDMRVFDFKYNLIPQSVEDQDAIMAIIKFFQFHSSPGGDKETEGTLDYPSVFNITFQGKSAAFLPKIQPEVVCTSCIPTFENLDTGFYTGMPAKVSLELKFSEQKIVTKEDFR